MPSLELTARGGQAVGVRLLHRGQELAPGLRHDEQGPLLAFAASGRALSLARLETLRELGADEGLWLSSRPEIVLESEAVCELLLWAQGQETRPLRRRASSLSR